MTNAGHPASERVLIIGSGHLAYRIGVLAAARGIPSIQRTGQAAMAAVAHAGAGDLAFDHVTRALHEIDLRGISKVFLVDDSDERNLALLIALISLDAELPIVASLFNQNVAPHLQAANPNVRILNPAQIAAPAFIAALDIPLSHPIRYVPTRIAEQLPTVESDVLLRRLSLAFLALMLAATTYFHLAEGFSWLNALYFVVVTMATVGYGDISLVNASAMSKMMGIGLILGSTAFIWMIFSLTVDNIIKRRVQFALGRRRYSHTGHVILCGLGRLGYFIAEGLLARGESVIIIEVNEDSPKIDHFRRRGAEVYIGDARLPRVLDDVGVGRAKALFSVTDNDFANLEIGLNARSFDPKLRLVLRIFDEATSQRVRDILDIHLTYSMTAIADEQFFTTS